MDDMVWTIPKEILKENCKEYRFENNLEFWKIFSLDELIYESLQYSSPGDPFPDFSCIDEGLIKTYSAEVMRRYILTNFPEIDPRQVRILKIHPEGGEKIALERLAMFIPDKGKNGQRLSDMMRLGGYTLAREISGTGELGQWKTLVFTPNFQVPRNMEDVNYLWHISPKRYEQSILKYGFRPYSRNEVYKYPDRIYFFTDDLSPETVATLGEKLYKAAKPKNPEYVDNEAYVLYRIKIYDLVDYNFYTDPDWGGAAVYTTEAIPPSAIVSKRNVRYSKPTRQ